MAGRGWDREDALSIGYLTDWHELSLVVNQRAQGKDIKLADQLTLPGLNITPYLSPRAALAQTIRFKQMGSRRIRNGHRAGVPPHRLARRHGAVGDARGAATDGRAAEVWAARLANPTKTAMRALWARGMSVKNNGSGDLRIEAAQHAPNFTGSLCDQDRAEIAALSSFYGMVALRSLQIVDGTTTIDDPASMVARPDPVNGRDFNCLQDSSTVRWGFVSPKPFDQFSLSLSRSATINAYGTASRRARTEAYTAS